MGGQVSLGTQPRTWSQLTRRDAGGDVVSNPKVSEIGITAAEGPYVLLMMTVVVAGDPLTMAMQLDALMRDARQQSRRVPLTVERAADDLWR